MTLRLGASTPTLSIGSQKVKKAYRGSQEIFTADLGVGGLLSVEISPDGWYADLTFAGQVVGGTYDFGLDPATNFDPSVSVPKLVFTVTSLGFDDAGLATTITRTIYGTKEVRKAWPNHAERQETVFNTSDVKIRVALSDYIYAKDKAGVGNSGTDVSVTVLAGLYTANTTPSLGGTLNATNNSTAAYPKVVGNWTWPGRQKVGSTITPRATFFHQSARRGRPVRAVRFTANGITSGASVTQTILNPTVDSTIGDANPVVEYVGSLSTAGFTQGEVILVRAEAFPWWGDSYLDSANGPPQPTPLFSDKRVVCDKNGTYTTSFAVVDPTAAAGTGAVGTGTLDTAAPPASYPTIYEAANALRTHNSTAHGRANRAGSVIYLKNGDHAWTGGTITADSVAAETWLTVTRYPTTARSEVRLASVTGTKNVGLFVRLLDISITASSSGGVLATTPGGELWIDKCEITNTTGPLAYLSGKMGIYYTRNLVTQLATGMKPFGAVDNWVTLVRGNTVVTAQQAITMTFVGNRRDALSTNNSAMVQDTQGNTANGPFMDNVVVAFNKWTHVTTSTPVGYLGAGTVARPHGLAIVQNVLESVGPASQPTLQVTADGSTGGPIDNVLIWHNTIVGERFSIGYDEVAPATTPDVAPSHRRYWSVKNNIADNLNTKHDIFGGTVGQSGYYANAGKTGGWPVLYGVGFSGNLFAETAGGPGSTGPVGAGGSFALRFPGLRSRQGLNNMVLGTGDPASETVSQNVYDYIKFVRRGSGIGQGTTGAGNGDYALLDTSPVKGMAYSWILPFDVTGAPRKSVSDPGANAAKALSVAAWGRWEAGKGQTLDSSGRVTDWTDLISGKRFTAAVAGAGPVASVDRDGRKRLEIKNDGLMDLTAALDERSLSIFIAGRGALPANGNVMAMMNYAGNASFLRWASTSSTDVPQTLYRVGNTDPSFTHLANPAVMGAVSGTTGNQVIRLGADRVITTAAVTDDSDGITGLRLGGGQSSTTSGKANMDVYEVVVYDRPLTEAEADEVWTYLTEKWSTQATPTTKNLVMVGDSITQGTGTTLGRGFPWYVTNKDNVATWRQTNLGTSGATMASTATKNLLIDKHIRAGSHNVLHLLIGRNDAGTLTGAQIYDEIKAWVPGRITAGWDEVWVGTVPQPDSATNSIALALNDLNALLRGTPDGGTGPGILAEVAGVTKLIDYRDLPGGKTSANYQGDNTHPTVEFAKEMGEHLALYISEAGVPSAAPAWIDRFETLDLATPETTATARWLPVDTWQNINLGYVDFAATSWNLNPNETLGGAKRTAFSVGPDGLTIKAIRTPAEWNTDIAASMAAQGQTGEVPAWSGGIVISNKAVKRFKYGYIAIKAKLPTPGRGMFPALWLFAADGSDNVEGKGSAEIDIFEVFGHATGQPWSITTHYRDNANAVVRASVDVTTQNTDTAGWHVYGVDWQPTYLRFYKDGELVAELTGEDASWFNTDMALRLNYAMDASWFPTKSDVSTPAELTMDIQWVGQWAESGFPYTPPEVPSTTTIVDTFGGADGAVWDAAKWTTASTAGGTFTQQGGDGRITTSAAGNYGDKMQAYGVDTFTGGEYQYHVEITSKAEYNLYMYAHSSGTPVDWSGLPENGYVLRYSPVTDAAEFSSAAGWATTALGTATVTSVVGDIIHFAIKPGTGVYIWKNDGTRPTLPTIESADVTYTSGKFGVGMQGGGAVAATSIDIQSVEYAPDA